MENETIIYIKEEEFVNVLKRCLNGVSKRDYSINIDGRYIIKGYRCLISNNNFFKKPELINLLTSKIKNINEIIYKKYFSTIRYVISR